MSWTNPKSWAGSEVLTSGDMNTYVGSNTDYLFDNMPTANSWFESGTNVTQYNQRIERGRGFISFSTGYYGTKDITFNATFGSHPSVLITSYRADTNLVGMFCTALNCGTAGFRVLMETSGGTYTGTQYFTWFAIGA